MTFNVLNMIEVTGRRGELRRRWLEIEGVFTNMNLWPFGRKLETREDAYTDALVAALVSRSEGKTLATPSAIGALEACAGAVGRGFMAAEISGPDTLIQALTPDCLELVGRSLMRHGEVVFLIDTTGGMLRLIPVATHDVDGGPLPESWEYRLTVAGPSQMLTYTNVPYASVLHFRYAVDSARPWRGNSPLDVASLTGQLSAETLRVLSEEASGPVGRDARHTQRRQRRNRIQH